MKQESPYSYNSFIHFVQDNFVLLVIAALFFAGGFFFGSLWTENNLRKNGIGGGGGGTTAPAVADPSAVAPTGPTLEQLNTMPEVANADHKLGAARPKVTLVEYSDFECPFCARFHPTAKQVIEEFGDQVQLVYRHYPLPFHPNAQKAAEASECVAKLGGNDAFWKYADAIFAKQNELGGQLNPTAITEAATGTGVNAAAFTKCLDSGEMAAAVKEDMDGGSGAGISGTPGTLVVTEDGVQELIPGAFPYADVKTIVEKYL